MHHSKIVGVVGNPNCGKTTLFNVLTGSRQQVGNWPGVTVEKKTGTYVFAGNSYEVVDLPGTYSLESADDEVSLDEKIARDYVASKSADVIVNILDASNIERNLYLTAQLLEMQVPVIVALNMMDVAKQRNIEVNIKKLSALLGCPVVAITATSNKGIDTLKSEIKNCAAQPKLSDVVISYAGELEAGIQDLSLQLVQQARESNCALRWLSLRLLEGDTLAERIAGKAALVHAQKIRDLVEEKTEDEIDILAADGRYGFVNQITRRCISRQTEVNAYTTEQIDRIVLNRFLGIPVFLAVMYLMFMFTINFGTAFVDFFDQFTGAFLIDGLSVLLAETGCPEWLTVLFTNGLGGGVQVVATFIPIVGFLFLFLSVLEDSGYMARAAFVMDRFMRMMGLPGKSFVPMIVGFGCNVPAIMATRTLENPRDRILTNIMNPFMSCGARLPVYALFAAAFFPVGGQNLVFGLYLFGITIAVLTGLIMRLTLFKGDVTPFIMELPAYHLPRLYSVLLKTWDRLKTFLFNAGKVIVPMVLVLNVLNSIGTDGSFGQENTEKSMLSEIGRSLTPVFRPMGITTDNWPATVGIFTGLLAKEAVVGTLNALYSEQAEGNTGTVASKFDLKAALWAATMTIPTNLSAIANNLLDPLGLDIGNIQDAEAAAEQQAVAKGTFGAMQKSFDGKIGAFAYLLFILLYAPCVAATTAIFRETNLSWAVFVVLWTTGIAYMIATVFYQAMTFSRHPADSAFWIALLFSIFALLIASFWITGNYSNESTNLKGIKDDFV